MVKPRIIIADTDPSYIVPLLAKFVYEFFNKVTIEVIDDEAYFRELFSRPQSVDILVVSEALYDLSLKKHDIAHAFVMMEQNETGSTSDLSVNRLFKYSSVKEVYNEIVGKSADSLNIEESKAETRIIMIYSASGGSGKTTVAMGISASLSKSYKKVLYINASHMQTFHYMMNNKVAVNDTEVYTELMRQDGDLYHRIKQAIRQESFYYLPPFRTSLLSLGLSYSVFYAIAESARRSGDYDFIIIDVDTVFDEENAALMSLADKVILVCEQSRASVCATNELVANINGIRNDKYIFVCNKFDKDSSNAMVSEELEVNYSVSGYIEKIHHYDRLTAAELGNIPGIQKVALLLT